MTNIIIIVIMTLPTGRLIVSAGFCGSSTLALIERVFIPQLDIMKLNVTNVHKARLGTYMWGQISSGVSGPLPFFIGSLMFTDLFESSFFIPLVVTLVREDGRALTPIPLVFMRTRWSRQQSFHMRKAFTYRGNHDLGLLIVGCCRKMPSARRKNQDCILAFFFRIPGRVRFCGDHLGAGSPRSPQQSTKKADLREYGGGIEDQGTEEMLKDRHVRPCVHDLIYRCGTLVYLCDQQGHCRGTHILILWRQDRGVSIQIVAWRRLIRWDRYVNQEMECREWKDWK